MKKKLFSSVFALLAVLICIECNVFAVNPAVIDEAGYLSGPQLYDILEKLDAIREKYNFDVAVVIEENMRYSDEEQAADDIFDYNGYGLGSGKDGILLYISKNPRKYHFSTHGYGETAFSGRGLVHLRDEVLPYLQNNDYYNALLKYASVADEMLAMAKDGKPYNDPGGMQKLIAWAAAVIIPLIIAAFATHSRGKRMNTAVYQTYADSYMKPGSMNLAVSKDLFVYSTIARTERVRNESGGGHTSSSGEHHGGIGGSY